jgi:glycerophosphoryl diester phosphodiesterase
MWSLRRTTMIAAAVLAGALLWSVAVGGSASPAVTCPPVVAHRGAGAGFPSGSRAAFPAAVGLGATILEFDVRFARTGEPVVYHDAEISAGTNGTGLVAELSLAQLRQFAIDGTTPGTQRSIPTLGEVLHDSKQAGAQRYIIELKTRPTATQRRAFLTQINAVGLSPRVVVESFSAATLADIATAAPALKRAMVVSRYTDPAVVRRSGTAFVPHYSLVTDAYVRDLHAAGVTEIYPWTANTRGTWSAMAGAGVSGTITDLTANYLIAHCRIPVRRH